MLSEEEREEPTTYVWEVEGGEDSEDEYDD